MRVDENCMGDARTLLCEMNQANYGLVNNIKHYG